MPARRKLLWKLYPSYLIIIVISLLAVGGYASSALRTFYLDQKRGELESKARLVGELIGLKFSLRYAPEVDGICKEARERVSARITVILPNGVVIGDSDQDPSAMENHLDRPEVGQALAGKVGFAIRSSSTESVRMIYVAVPAKIGDTLIGLVRAAEPMTHIDRTLYSIYGKITLAGLIVALFAALLSLVMAERINRPLNAMKRGAQRFAAGELDYRLYMPASEEMNALAEAMNSMAAQLQDRIQAIEEQKNELEAVLSGMVEAVLVVDCDQTILRVNKAAAELLGLRPEDSGRSIQEAVRNAALQKFVARTLASKEPLLADIILYSEGEKYLQAHGTLLKDARGQSVGALFVLNDISNLKKLENIRKDFVANVSHELRTPITSIKGFVETLKEGALSEPENAQRFLEIISSHADRLNAIIEDLLSLSRIEQSEESGTIAVADTALKDVLDSAVLLNSGRAAEKKITIEVDAPADLKVRINAPLMEQAVSNLIDNALKYSEPGEIVRVKAERQEKEVVISVQDFGTGIPREDLPRIFERFYRVDKARSRKLGGTGLGLAIVKHIVQAHKGRVSVVSALGEGSKFFIYLPCA